MRALLQPLWVSCHSRWAVTPATFLPHKGWDAPSLVSVRQSLIALIRGGVKPLLHNVPTPLVCSTYTCTDTQVSLRCCVESVFVAVRDGLNKTHWSGNTPYEANCDWRICVRFILAVTVQVVINFSVSFSCALWAGYKELLNKDACFCFFHLHCRIKLKCSKTPSGETVKLYGMLPLWAVLCLWFDCRCYKSVFMCALVHVRYIYNDGSSAWS